ncbi:MAG: ABC transporter substrate-binding protein [Candidatus Methanomethylophilaceae archaeon]|nr:ABC transporter substrate-binding protein [Candidatus Methanomethylophilaceae archaeon]
MDNKLIAIIVVAILVVAGVAAYVVLGNSGGSNNGKKTVGDGIDTTVPIYGNANGDAYIDDKDVELLKDLKDHGWDPVKYPYADADLDGFITDKDVTLVNKIINKQSCELNYMSHFGTVMSVKYPMTGKNIGVTYWQQAEMMAALGLWNQVKVGPNNLTAYYGGIYDLSGVDIYTAKNNHNSGVTDDAVEKFVENNVDIIIATPTAVNLSALEKLMDRGVQCVFLWYTGDWCIPTMMALGIILGAEEKAKAYMDYALGVIDKINDRLKNTERPNVIVAGGSKKVADDGVTTTISVYTSPMEGDYYFTNLVANAYTNSSGLSEFGASSRSYEWFLLNDDLLKYILIYQNQTGFAYGAPDSGKIITQEEFNQRFESTVGTFQELTAYKNGNCIGIPYDMFGGISGYALTIMIAHMIYPDLFTLSEAQDMLQKWFDDFTVAHIDVRTQGGYYYNGSAYPASYLS